DPCGLGGDGGGVGGQHDDVDGVGRQRLRSGDALGRGGVELAVEVLGDDQDFGHGRSPCRSGLLARRANEWMAGVGGVAPTYSRPFCFSAATSSAASFTITPRLRLGGGA